MNIDDFLKENGDLNKDRTDSIKEQMESKKHEEELAKVLQAIDSVSSKISKSIERQADIINVDFPKSISTPDISKVVDELKILKSEFSKDKSDKEVPKLLNNLIKAVQSLPTPEKVNVPDSVSVNNQLDYSKKFDAVVKAVKDIKLEVKGESDFGKLEKKLDILTGAVKAISIVVPSLDDNKILRSLANVSKSINGLSFPTSNFILPFKKADGSATQVEASIFNDINGIGIPAYDSCSLVEATLTDTWSFFIGSISGTKVATVLITYTDASKGTISTVERT
jgi:hypothetical protein